MSKKRKERKIKRQLQEKKEKYKKFSKVFYLDKSVGETPLEILDEFKETDTFLNWQKEAKAICGKRVVRKKGCSKIPLAYAGRLDPMAEGRMLILAGEACKEREKYLGLDKEYVFEVLLAFESDSADILGLIKNDKEYGEIDALKLEKKLPQILKNMMGKRKMKYPAFSSKAVNGKPLFLWALEKRLDEIEIPSKEVEIYDIKSLGVRNISSQVLKKVVFRKILSLKTVDVESKRLGEDFRRVEVLNSWEKSLSEFPSEMNFTVIKIQTTVSSGTYMRNLASEIGEALGTTGLAYSIKRTKMGKLKNFFGVKLWSNIL